MAVTSQRFKPIQCKQTHKQESEKEKSELKPDSALLASYVCIYSMSIGRHYIYSLCT